MLRKVFLITLLFSQFLIFPKTSLAVQSCSNSGVTWAPNIFPEGETQYIINFTINNPNTLSSIKSSGPYIRILADYWESLVGGIRSGGTFSGSVKVDGEKFSITASTPLSNPGVHKGLLQWSSTETGPFNDFCSDFIYQVGAGTKCTLQWASIPDKLPPNSTITVRFVGTADTTYVLRLGNNAPLATIKTDAQGQGEFPPVVISGNNGDTVKVNVVNQTKLDDYCSKVSRIDVTAPVPAPAPAGPVQPAAAEPVFKICTQKDIEEGKCTLAGGKQCGGPNDPAIATAIGCIHTNPPALVKDILTFSVGIGGGLAFLMMLLGAFQMLTSGGNPETLAAGRSRITSAVIGLLFVIFSVLLLQIIGVDILKLPDFG